MVLWVEARQVQPLVVQFVQIAEICDVRTLRHEHLLRDAVARLLRLLHLLLVAHDWARALAARAASSRVPVFQPLYRTRTTGRRARSAAHHLGRARRRGRWNVTHAAAVRLHEVCRAPGLHDGALHRPLRNRSTHGSRAVRPHGAAVKMLPAARVLLAAIVVLAAEVAPSSKLALNRGYAACTFPPADVLRRRSLAAAAPAVSASGAACPPPPAPGSSCTELESVVTSSYYPGDPARTAVSCWIYDEDVKAKRCSLDLDSGPAGGGGVQVKCWQQCAKDAAGAAGAAAWELLPGVAHDGQSTGPHTICAIYNAVPGNRALKGPSFDSRSASGCTALGVSRDNASATSCCKDAPPLPPPTAPDWHCAGPPCWHCIPKPPGNTTTGIPLKDCELGCWYRNVFLRCSLY